MPDIDSSRLATYKYITELLNEGSNKSLQCPTKSQIINSYVTVSKPPFGSELDLYSDSQCVMEKDIKLGVVAVVIIDNKGGTISFENEGTTYHKEDTPANIKVGTYLICSTTASSKNFDKIMWWTGDDSVPFNYLLTGPITVTANYYNLKSPDQFNINWQSQLINITGFNSSKNESLFDRILIDDYPSWLVQTGSSGTSLLINIEENKDIDNRSYRLHGYQEESNLKFMVNIDQRGRRTYVNWDNTDQIDVDWSTTNGGLRFILYDGYFNDGAIVESSDTSWLNYLPNSNKIDIRVNTDTILGRTATLTLKGDGNKIVVGDKNTITVTQTRKLVITYKNAKFSIDPSSIVLPPEGGNVSLTVISQADRFENDTQVETVDLPYKVDIYDDWIEVSDLGYIFCKPNEDNVSRTASVVFTQESTNTVKYVTIIQRTTSNLITRILDQYFSPVRGFLVYYDEELVGYTDSEGMVSHGPYSGQSVEVRAEYGGRGYKEVSGVGLFNGSGYDMLTLYSSNARTLVINCNISNFTVNYNNYNISSSSGVIRIEEPYGTTIPRITVSAPGYTSEYIESFSLYSDKIIEINLVDKIPTYTIDFIFDIFKASIEYNEIETNIGFTTTYISYFPDFDPKSFSVDYDGDLKSAIISEVKFNESTKEYTGNIKVSFDGINDSYSSDRKGNIQLNCSDDRLVPIIKGLVITQKKKSYEIPSTGRRVIVDMSTFLNRKNYYAAEVTMGTSESLEESTYNYLRDYQSGPARLALLMVGSAYDESKAANVRIFNKSVNYRTSEYDNWKSGDVGSPDPSTVSWKAGESGDKYVELN